MDDGKLRALLTAVDCGSFSKAAAQLGYTQSAMTHLVNKLEAEIGCTLLERDSQGIRLTDAGRQLLPYIQNVVCACDTLLQEAAEQSDPRKRTLRIGCFASIARARLPELLRAFRAEHPEIQLDVLVRSEELTTALASGRIQLALVDEARAKGFDFQPLADAPLVAAVPPDFPWEGDTIPLEPGSVYRAVSPGGCAARRGLGVGRRGDPLHGRGGARCGGALVVLARRV